MVQVTIVRAGGRILVAASPSDETATPVAYIEFRINGQLTETIDRYPYTYTIDRAGLRAKSKLRATVVCEDGTLAKSTLHPLN